MPLSSHTARVPVNGSVAIDLDIGFPDAVQVAKIVRHRTQCKTGKRMWTWGQHDHPPKTATNTLRAAGHTNIAAGLREMPTTASADRWTSSTSPDLHSSKIKRLCNSPAPVSRNYSSPQRPDLPNMT
ncbi:hypothetical protein ABZS95_36875 [Streptomyces sp. NPDC005479]|uniref:hypothetical protein n=1 Tax=Streptomyces sp. NPDC005479 TaxID=3154879 RepID=UPI0033A7D9DE